MTDRAQPRERPLLFSAPMVRAILDGRKTQTRRALKMQPLEILTPADKRASLARVTRKWNGRRVWFALTERDPNRGVAFRCKYGEVGDRLWVTWRSPIFCPRWASRITLEITDVRVARVCDISEADARAEGCEPHMSGTWWQGYRHFGDDLIHQEYRGDAPPDWMIEPKRMKPTPWLDRSARDAYRVLWDSINGPGSWDANPFVWVLTFRRI